MSIAVRRYSFRSPVFFVLDMEEGQVRTNAPLLNDVPASVRFDETQAKKREKLLFHIDSGDYFGMLATALGFVEETLSPPGRALLREKRAVPSEEVLLVRDLRNDLRYLHDNYDIRPKKKGARQRTTA